MKYVLIVTEKNIIIMDLNFSLIYEYLLSINPVSFCLKKKNLKLFIFADNNSVYAFKLNSISKLLVI